METVSELTGDEDGVWRVTTMGSSHIINFVRGTVTRIPGIGRNVSINDLERPLRTIDACKVGEIGRWTMRSDDFFTDYYWQQTSTIQRIELLTGLELGKAATEVALQNIAASDGLYTAAEVASVLEVSAETVQELFAAGQLIGLTWKEELVFPGCQLNRGHDAVAAFVEPLIAAATELGYSLRGLTFWLYSPTNYFGGSTPVSYADQPELLEKTFRESAGVEW